MSLVFRTSTSNRPVDINTRLPHQEACGILEWFNKPSAVYYNGRTYFSWVGYDLDSGLNLMQIRAYNHDTDEFSAIVTLDELDDDLEDHSSPALCVIPEGDDAGQILAMWTTHGPTHWGPIRYSRTTVAEDITSFPAYSTVPDPDGASTSITRSYPLPVYVGGGKVLAFWRHGPANAQRDTMQALSSNGGETFATATILVDGDTGNRQFYHYLDYRDGVLHMVFQEDMTGSPQRVFYAKNDNPGEGTTWKKADGTTITTNPSSTPLRETNMGLVFTPSSGAWMWDLRADSTGAPCVVLADDILSKSRTYKYVYWTGSAWSTKTVLTGVGNALEARTADTPIVYTAGIYATGIVLDLEHPDTTVYLSKDRNGIFEMEKFTSGDRTTWTLDERLTQRSQAHQFRPMMVETATKGTPPVGPTIVWCSGYYDSFSDDTAQSGSPYAPTRTDPPWYTVLMSDGTLKADTFVKLPEGIQYVDTICGFYNGMRHPGGTQRSIPLAADAGRNIVPISTFSPLAAGSITGTTYAAGNFSAPVFVAGTAGMRLWESVGTGNLQLYLRVFAQVTSFTTATSASVQAALGTRQLAEVVVTATGSAGHKLSAWVPVPRSIAQMAVEGKIAASGSAAYAAGAVGVQFGVGPKTSPVGP